MAGVGATWTWKPSGPEEVGYFIAVLVEQRSDPGTHICSELPSSAQATVNGMALPLVTDPDSHCVTGKLALGPYLRDQSVSLRIADGDQILAEGTFENLMPGTAARLITPPDGKVHAGDEVVFVPPTALPTSQATLSYIFVAGVQTSAFPTSERQADGIHVKVPAFVGDGVLVVRGMPYSPEATVDCSGFAVCVGDADSTVGPIFITGEP